jgi:transcriptional regulator with XRE-family HTH domain
MMKLRWFSDKHPIWKGRKGMFSTNLRVKELLRERNWTTKILAEKTGMSESYLTHIKNGTRRWNEDALKKISEAFDTDPIELFVHRKLPNLPTAYLAQTQKQSTLPLNVRNIPVMN